MRYRDSLGISTKVVEYDYDVLNRRIAKRVDDEADGNFDRAEKYVYDGADVVLVFDDAGSLTTRFLHGPAVDQVFASEDALGEVLWSLPDNQGTVRDLAEYDSGTDTTSVVNHRKYDSFGILTSDPTPALSSCTRTRVAFGTATRNCTTIGRGGMTQTSDGS